MTPAQMKATLAKVDATTRASIEHTANFRPGPTFDDSACTDPRCSKPRCSCQRRTR